ncbi:MULTISPECIES: AAA family ATPase [Solibacillus]|uniref:AAA family ATPase n=1 Tax=Solibacillus merdavium TaxID=2762218 RepID=A0ABR8XQH3_9BACL|nr:AAA family ATPase [Solibacillus merdavium]MBD8034177.1 AAA family ATPase [Solibacillus merdavium]
MELLSHQVKDFLTEEKEQYHEKLHHLYNEFIQEFSLEDLPNLPLEKYALGYAEGSFGWWLEYKTSEIGSIKGGSASKHVIYYKKKEKEWFYPEQYSSEHEAWQALRKDILEVVEHAHKIPYEKIPETNLLYSKSMLKGKISYMYAPKKMFPIFQVQHLKHFLSVVGVEEASVKDKDCVELSRMLHDKVYALPNMEGFDELVVANFFYTYYSPSEKVYKLAPGENANLWPRCKEAKEIAIGWDILGDLNQYTSFNELRTALEAAGIYTNASTITKKANEIWMFYQLKQGDLVVANKGASKIIAIGKVNERGYEYKNYDEKRHTIGVDWTDIWESGYDIPTQNRWKTITVEAFSHASLQKWLKEEKAVVKEKESFEDTSFFEEIERAVKRKGQVILYGPPGTGKTFTIQQYLKWLQTKDEVVSEFCTFHPSFQYEDFIEGFKPIVGEQNTIAFKLEDGIFKSFVKQAKAEPKKRFVFIIDELNRGNIPKIFGELITLLEKDKRGLELRLPQSKEAFSIPENVQLLCTMNTADRSIKMMDAAIKRRFAFVECMPNYDVLNEPLEDLSVTPANILKHLNGRLTKLQGRDLQIGHAYFMTEGKVANSIDEFMDLFRYDIIPLLQEYCFDNYEALEDLIGSSFVDVVNNELNQNIFTKEAFISAIEQHFQVNYEE